MKRYEFLRELQENLAGKLSESAIGEILYDYTEHFDAGTRDGKTEDEVSQELGSPARIAKDILDDTLQASSSGVMPARPIPRPEPFADSQYAAKGPRILAFMLDAILASIPLTLVTKSLLLMVLSPLALVPVLAFSMYLPTDQAPPQAIAIGALAFYLLYHPVSMVLFRGRTIGKMIMGLQVVRKDGGKVRITDIVVREVLIKILPVAIFPLFAAVHLGSLIWALVSREGKTLHDEIGGTRVVNSLESSTWIRS